MISRFGENERDTARALAVLALQLTVSGVPFIFQGEELGLTDYRAQRADQLFDIQGITHYQTALDAGKSAETALTLALEHSRDGSRAPIPWRDAPFGGFSTDYAVDARQRRYRAAECPVSANGRGITLAPLSSPHHPSPPNGGVNPRSAGAARADQCVYLVYTPQRQRTGMGRH